MGIIMWCPLLLVVAHFKIIILINAMDAVRCQKGMANSMFFAQTPQSRD